MALDDRYANNFAPLDSMAIYPKPGHKLLYTPMTGEMKCLSVDAKVDLQTQRANTRIDIQGVPVDLTC